jgi:hypothetical protein
MDAHWGNFLYHKIKPGGYIHYKIYDNDIYIKNMGYMWIIWDYMIKKKDDEEYKRKSVEELIKIFNDLDKEDKKELERVFGVEITVESLEKANE